MHQQVTMLMHTAVYVSIQQVAMLIHTAVLSMWSSASGDAHAHIDSFHMDLHFTLLWASLTDWVSVSPALSQFSLTLSSHLWMAGQRKGTSRDSHLLLAGHFK